jgi:hypothetical protein
MMDPVQLASKIPTPAIWDQTHYTWLTPGGSSGGSAASEGAPANNAAVMKYGTDQANDPTNHVLAPALGVVPAISSRGGSNDPLHVDGHGKRIATLLPGSKRERRPVVKDTGPDTETQPFRSPRCYSCAAGGAEDGGVPLATGADGESLISFLFPLSLDFISFA